MQSPDIASLNLAMAQKKTPLKYAGCVVAASSRHVKMAFEIGAEWFSGRAAGHELEEESIRSMGET